MLLQERIPKLFKEAIKDQEVPPLKYLYYFLIKQTLQIKDYFSG